ncbi:MAG: hypothetical protein J7647_16285 [Cyanobacteria bacterium SBLK]|nr:hypothetical protein [Cyanobacteria bacterium SBLK]
MLGRERKGIDGFGLGGHSDRVPNFTATHVRHDRDRAERISSGVFFEDNGDRACMKERLYRRERAPTGLK